MKITTPLQSASKHLPILSSQDRGWEHIVVEQFQCPPGECTMHHNDEHTICLSLSPRPIRFFQIKGGKSYSSLYGKGDISITPAKMPLFVRWEEKDNYLQIRIAAQFIQRVARESLDKNPDRLEFLPEFRLRDPQMESIALMLFKELQQENLGSQLYIDSLTNVLAVHLLRQYVTTKPQITSYRGGLNERQLLPVLDYIHDYLDREINLADLANLIGVSQFHFSHLFKQSLGISPYQYLLQQRIERAKQLLQQTDRSIVDIALACGFNSHSHLSKQFRQLTGTTPSKYRGK
ncbi:MAG: helix-turn-helix domain-containing protein [Oscillatoriaceae cyanobacterium Prado104]|jgi:AraC family transcriptional regulator|nr:helix-turn-helix domain-containing protein [Oscillatoriaceae cyanobacterium Prado104]